MCLQPKMDFQRLGVLQVHNGRNQRPVCVHASQPASNLWRMLMQDTACSIHQCRTAPSCIPRGLLLA